MRVPRTYRRQRGQGIDDAAHLRHLMFKSISAPLRLALAVLLAGLVAPQFALRADIALPPIFSDHAVLQKGNHIPIWGTAAPGEKVTVTVGSASASDITPVTGKWQVWLDLLALGQGPFDLIAQGNNRLTVSDVLVGEVWFCSGQSNMELPMTQVTDATHEIAASADPSLRQFLVVKKFSATPSTTAAGKWTVASPDTTSQFTAVGYFFSRQLRKELAQPVGLINSTWGGTEIEAWTSAEALDKDPALQEGKSNAIARRLAFDNYIPAYQAWQKQFGREDHPVPDPAAFAGPDIPTDAWKKVVLPARLSAFGLPAAGAVWIRREITIEPAMSNHSLDLFLGDLRDAAQVYWNGHEIAVGRVTTIEQRYDVPANLVQAGKAVLAVRIYNPAEGLGIEPGQTRFRYGGSQSLQGEWLAKTEYELPALDAQALKDFPKRPPLPLPSQRVASWLFNGMVSPLIPYGVRGVLWYQGEQNVPQGFQYRIAFPLLINDWRERWGQKDLPFYFCQLPNINAPNPHPTEGGWPELRESQSKALALPQTGEAVLIDVGEAGNIHPKDKQVVGERLAHIALAKTYGKAVVCSGPVFASAATTGDKVCVSFVPEDSKLVAKTLPPTYRPLSNNPAEVPLVRNTPSGEVEGFAICGADKKWKWATAQIDGNTVLVWSPEVPAPVAVRYAWADNPVCNLYNAAGLPAAPFRTDDFPASTLATKY